ncbi:MAG: vitamin K epoxide reductase family protein [Anaerolineales bacterium]
MRKSLILLITLLLVIPLPSSILAAPAQSEQPMVHAVLFYSNRCPYCEQVLTGILPTAQKKYQSQLSVLLVELATSKDVDNLYALAASFGLSKEQVTVPFMVIDRTVLVGVDDINSKLTDLIDHYLFLGGVDFPNIPLLSNMLTQGVQFNSSALYQQLVSQPALGSNNIGLALAWLTMVLMGISLIYSIAMILRAFQGKSLRELKIWMNFAIPLLSMIGLGAAIYLSYVEITHTRALCGLFGDCNAVQSSPYARLFGILPIGLVGVFGYTAILAIWLWQRFRVDAIAKTAGPIMYGMALFGTLFSIYLTYLEIFVIHAVCMWCLSSTAIITALMLLNLPPITHWLAITDDTE